jgi:hypothetical protein
MKALRSLIILLAVFLIFPVISLAEENSIVEVERSARVDRAKLTFPIRLSNQEKTTLASRCKKAQSNLSKIKVRLEARESIISIKYNLIEQHLLAVSKRLSANQSDTSIIDLLLTNYQKLTSEHQQAFTGYQLALDDATTINCADDPQAFKALVEDVRTKRQDYVTTVNAIKDFSSAELKTSFDALRTRLNSRSEQ